MKKRHALLPCPWCYGLPITYHDHGRVRIACDGVGYRGRGCGVFPETGWRDSIEEATKAWNDRYCGRLLRPVAKLKARRKTR